jgi:hypothetical protein
MLQKFPDLVKVVDVNVVTAVVAHPVVIAVAGKKI